MSDRLNAAWGMAVAFALPLAFSCGDAKDRDRDAGQAPRGGQPAAMGGSSGSAGSAAGSMAPSPGMPDAGKPDPTPVDAGMPAQDAAVAPPTQRCAPRAIAGEAVMHFHHVHFNTLNPDLDLEFYETLFGSMGVSSVEFCKDETTQAPTWATRTDRGYFLYTKVDQAPDPALNTYLEHIGWLHPTPNSELMRVLALDAPLFPEGRGQCPEVFDAGIACGFDGYWFYVKAPSGAKVEIAKGPGPATMGFGHVHLIMGVDIPWIETLTGGAFHDGAINDVNHTSVSLEESFLDGEMVTETRGKPIDHVAYSTTDLEAHRMRIEAAGIAIAEDISFKRQYGFRSFFVKDAKGIWFEVVEDSPFQ